MFRYDELFLQNVMKGKVAHQNDVLSSQHIVDLGIIQSYNPDGSVNVLMLYFDQGQPVVFKGVELLYIGTNTSAMTYNTEGSLCLLLKPVTCIPDTKTMKIDFSATASSNTGMKAIPISNGANCTLNTGFDGLGNFFINGDGVSFTVSEGIIKTSFKGNSISFNAEGLMGMSLCGGKLLINHKNDGTSQFLRFDSNNKAAQYIKLNVDGSFVVKEHATQEFQGSDYENLDSFSHWLWVKTYSADGSRTFTLNDDNDEEQLSLTIGNDGQATLTKGTVTVQITESDNKQVLSLANNKTTIVIDGDGKITIDAGSNDVAISCAKLNVNDGNLEVT